MEAKWGKRGEWGIKIQGVRTFYIAEPVNCVAISSRSADRLKTLLNDYDDNKRSVFPSISKLRKENDIRISSPNQHRSFYISILLRGHPIVFKV